MIPIEVSVEPQEAVALIGKVRRRAEDLSPLFRKKFLPRFRKMERDLFSSEGAGATPKWKPLRLSTLRQKRRLGYGRKSIMRRTDRLFFSLTRNHPEATFEVTRFGVKMGTEVPYARFHQYAGRRGRLPRRQVIPDPLPRGFLNDLREFLAEYLEGLE